MKRNTTSCIAIAALLVASCGGGGGSNAGPAPGPVPPAATRLFTDPATVALTIADVQQILAQAVAEAKARGLPGTIVVVDRVGNVLAAYRMAGANTNLAVPPSPSGINHDLQGRIVPGGAVAGAISKAITGAYLSSSGNAFSTRTASQIVQEHFPPSAAARGLESGPLFGVQFSQLPCSDLSSRFGMAAPATFIGPKRSPLGLAADPGGFPLYKNGVVVGGVGVMADGVYGADPEIQDVDRDDEEAIALAATQGFAAAADIQADRVTVDGTSLRFSDAVVADLRTTASSVPGFGTLTAADGMLIAVNGYAAAAIIPGTAYGTEASGIRLAGPGEFANPDAYILTNGAGANRFPAIAGTDPVGQALTVVEVRAILEEAFKIMAAARAQIRRPLDSRAQVTISVVDLNGRALGIVRSPDAPIFGTDVSLQKARTAVFFSATHAAAELSANAAPLGGADVRNYVPQARAFFNDPTALTGQFAISDRGLGNVSRPYFPDGELGRPPGAFSRPIAEFNPFSTGLQSALILDQVLQHVGFILGNPMDTPQQCTLGPNPGRLANGIQIFPGSVPIYRGNTLVGGIGVSGDGIDQDDMISFLGLHNGGLRVGTVGNAPAAIRSDQIVVPVAGASGGGVRLRWVNCPFNPFIGTNEQNVCQGK
ncbi:MAG TPA: heme-binding protein [Allosphingosinicella sp.]|nr:heme-binding protein [Allosphingosinicella sp.]